MPQGDCQAVAVYMINGIWKKTVPPPEQLITAIAPDVNLGSPAIQGLPNMGPKVFVLDKVRRNDCLGPRLQVQGCSLLVFADF